MFTIFFYPSRVFLLGMILQSKVEQILCDASEVSFSSDQDLGRRKAFHILFFPPCVCVLCTIHRTHTYVLGELYIGTHVSVWRELYLPFNFLCLLHQMNFGNI